MHPITQLQGVKEPSAAALSLMAAGELPQRSIGHALAHTGLTKPKNIEKPVVVEAFQLEMLKNHWFFKLWGHLDRDENNFVFFYVSKMRTMEHAQRSR